MEATHFNLLTSWAETKQLKSSCRSEKHSLNIFPTITSRQKSTSQLLFGSLPGYTFKRAESQRTQPPVGSPLPLIGCHITMVISMHWLQFYLCVDVSWLWNLKFMFLLWHAPTQEDGGLRLISRARLVIGFDFELGVHRCRHPHTHPPTYTPTYTHSLAQWKQITNLAVSYSCVSYNIAIHPTNHCCPIKKKHPHVFGNYKLSWLKKNCDCVRAANSSGKSDISRMHVFFCFLFL